MSKVSRLSPTIDPRVLKRYRPKDERGEETADDNTLEHMISAVSRAEETANNVAHAHEKIMADPMRTKLAKMKASRDLAFERVTKATRALDRASADADAEIQKITEETLEPITRRSSDPHDVAIASEVRAYLRDLKPDQRHKATQEMIDNADENSLSAVLNAPPHLSGMTPTHQDLVRDEYRHKKFKPQMDRLNRLKGAKEDLQKIGSLLIERSVSLTDGKAVRDAEALSAAAEKAAKAE